ncbi:MAG: hypothetical protein J7507_07180 [Pseudoxanthomonas sp.]|nr:hypothetical protein [Pseudoxanthomonas sp.]
MKTRRVYAAPNLAAAQAALAAARDTGIDPHSLSLIARSDIEMESVPDELREAHADTIPAALRGAAEGGAVGLVAGLVAVAIPPLGITLAGAGLIAAIGALVGSWSSALVGASVPDPVRRRFEETIAAGQILLVIDAEKDALARAEAAVVLTGATPLPYEAASALS